MEHSLPTERNALDAFDTRHPDQNQADTPVVTDSLELEREKP
jgi:hypothetical protein